jgi:hypothetical protein
MGFLDTLFGRKAPVTAKLDALFLLPSAAITLETAAGFKPVGAGAVCYRAADGAGAVQVQTDIVDLLDADADGPDVEKSVDSFGFTWLVTHQDDVSLLCNDLHAINTTLEENGFGSSLLCSLAPFVDTAGRKVGLVYLYKQGTFYPFAPTGPQSRDNLLEIQLRDQLAAELPMEKDLSRWMALWGAPTLS